jgi:hypothetical protein
MSASAAETIQRERLGELMRVTELNNAVRGDAFGRDRRYNRYCWFGRITDKTRDAAVISDRVFFEDALQGSITMFTQYAFILQPSRRLMLLV